MAREERCKNMAEQRGVHLKVLIRYIYANILHLGSSAKPIQYVFPMQDFIRQNVIGLVQLHSCCFHPEPMKRPGNKSSRHMKADSVVSCDWAQRRSLIFRFPWRYTEKPSSSCFSALQKQTSENNWDTLMRNIQQCVEACYLTGSSERCEVRRDEVGEGILKQKLREKRRKGVETPEGL